MRQICHRRWQLEQILEPRRFVRVHRSAIVNLERIRSLRTSDYRNFELLLEDGTASASPARIGAAWRLPWGLPLGRASRE
jgi:DNA-binding LytR/AlgR family response regulator